MQLKCYIFLIPLLYYHFFLEHNIYRFRCYNRKEGKSILSWRKTFRYSLTGFIFYTPKVIVRVILTIIYIFLIFVFNHHIRKPIIVAANEYHFLSSRKQQQTIRFCLVCCITILLQLRRYIVL